VQLDKLNHNHNAFLSSFTKSPGISIFESVYMLNWPTKKIFIYGTGTFARDIFNILTHHSIDVCGFLNHFSSTSVLQGIIVSVPDAPAPEIRANSAVVVGIHNRDANIAAIISRLKSLGYAQVITPVDLYDHFADELGVRYWLTQRTYYSGYGIQIDFVSRLFADQASQDLFNLILRFRVNGDYSILPPPDMQYQYFPSDLPVWKKPLRLIDCGAYNGDTLKNVLSLEIPIEATAAYEPDEVNFRKLAEMVRENRINATLWPCGVYSSTVQLRFTSGQGEASGLSKNGETVIQCVSLDESAPNFAPTLIKMDIEGAETHALRGAERIIGAYHPGLAICIYHAPEHLWEIPCLVNEIAQKYNLQYKYYLRAHGYNTFELVFYAIPTEGTI
jgi:FkbM family methyltransferase